MKVKKFIEKNLKWIILFICLVIVVALVEDILDKEIMQADTIGYNIVSKYLISDATEPIAKGITQLGGAVFLIIFSTILLIFLKNKK